MIQIPLAYHPTKLYWIDDDSLFLDVAMDRFNERYAITAVSSPKQAMSYFQNYCSYINKADFFSGCTDYEGYDFANQLPVNLDFNVLRDRLNDPKKINEIAVVVIDHQMPEITGLELCKFLSGMPAKKILLTGDADSKAAVDAFNEGVINCFIRKDDPELDSALVYNVDKLTREYFIDQTKYIASHIEVDVRLPHSDLIFANYVANLVRERNFVEYYLADKNGGIIFKDENGNEAYLVVHTDKSLNDFVDLHNDNGEAFSFLKSVIDRRKIPFFGVGMEFWGKEVASWASCFYSPNILEGRDKYYLALVDL